jgi:hypothetical protein
MIGFALSVTSTGKTQLGGGTTVYKSVDEIDASCPQYISTSALFESSFLTSYYDKSIGKC